MVAGQEPQETVEAEVLSQQNYNNHETSFHGSLCTDHFFPGSFLLWLLPKLHWAVAYLAVEAADSD